MILNDLLKANMDIVFCGTAVGNKSNKTKAYYAGSGNKFYRIIAETGFTPKQLHPLQYKKLLDYNIGLTDLVKNKSGNDNVLNKNDFDRDTLINNIEEYQPKILCFNGKAAASVFLFNRPNRTGDIEYGFMDNYIGKTRIFVAPSTSGSANGYWDESYWYELKEAILKSSYIIIFEYTK